MRFPSFLPSFQMMCGSSSSELDGHQQRMFSLLTLVFFLTLFGYWLIRPMKMGVFVSLVGIEHEPQAKLGTVIVMVPLLMIYNKMVASIANPRTLVSLVAGFYSVLFIIIALGLIPTYSETDEVVVDSENNPVVKEKVISGSQALGWLTYWTIESYGSIVVAMIWSVTASITDGPAARVVYPVFAIFNQLGSVFGATLATHTKYFGFPVLFFFQAILVMVSVLLLRRVLDIHDIRNSLGRALDKGAKVPDRPPTGLWEGLNLIVTRPYVLGIFIISTFAEVVSTIMDFRMKMLARYTYESGAQFSEFMGRFGQAANATSLILAVFGTQNVIKKLGVRFCLLTFPICITLLIAISFFYSSLWVLFWGMVALKALGYSLNGPAREMLYVRTSKDIKFKAKSWIDMTGTRGAKAIGSIVNNTFRHSMVSLERYGSLVSSGFTGIWLVVAFELGRVYKQYEMEEKYFE